jgi:hypothetical protein
MLLIEEEKPFGQEIQNLLDASDAYSMALDPKEGRHPVDISFLNSPQIRFFVARLDSLAFGCAALVTAGDATAELKRNDCSFSRPWLRSMLQFAPTCGKRCHGEQYPDHPT